MKHPNIVSFLKSFEGTWNKYWWTIYTIKAAWAVWKILHLVLTLVFHFNHIVSQLNVEYSVVSNYPGSKYIRFAAIRLKWKTALWLRSSLIWEIFLFMSRFVFQRLRHCFCGIFLVRCFARFFSWIPTSWGQWTVINNSYLLQLLFITVHWLRYINFMQGRGMLTFQRPPFQSLMPTTFFRNLFGLAITFWSIS